MNWLFSRVRRLWRWVLRLPRKVSIPTGLLLVAIAAVAVFYAVDFYGYMQHDPEFCQSCHVMEQSWDRWATSSHSEVGCHECHHQSMFASAGQLLSFIFASPERVEKHAAVEDESCEDCHENGDPQWRQVAATAGHRQHTEEEHISCVRCHSTTIHRFRPPAVICEVCHPGHRLEVMNMANMHCAVCHDFLADGEEPLPTRASCLDCHEALSAAVTWSADAPMQYPCGDCHLPHEQARPLEECLTCHTVDGYHLRGAHAAALCEDCHQAHEWDTAGRDTCLICHPGKTDHNPGVVCDSCHRFIGQ